MKANYFNIGVLIAKAMENRLTDEEAKRLNEWLNQSEANRQLMESIQSSDTLPSEVTFIRELDLDKAWEAIHQKRNVKRFGMRWKWVSAAAAILIVGMLSLWFMDSRTDHEPTRELVSRWGGDLMPAPSQATLVLSNGEQIPLSDSSSMVWAIHPLQPLDAEDTPQYHTLIVPQAGMFQFTLPDSTQVWLNANSKLRFPDSFPESERRVFLEGEAFFEVAGDERHPFVVDMEGTEVTVLGTTFNVSTFSGVAATLVEGAVRMTTGSASVMMNPGQLAQVDDGQIAVHQADLQQVLAWKNGEFYFRNQEIGEILAQLSQWYEFDVHYQGEIPNRHYTGGLARNVRLSEVLEMLAYVFRADFKIEGKSVEVSFASK